MRKAHFVIHLVVVKLARLAIAERIGERETPRNFGKIPIAQIGCGLFFVLFLPLLLRSFSLLSLLICDDFTGVGVDSIRVIHIPTGVEFLLFLLALFAKPLAEHLVVERIRE